MNRPSSRLSRRSFLLAAGTGGVAAVAAVAEKKQPLNTGKAGHAQSAKGYQVTEHVRKYYDTAKV